MALTFPLSPPPLPLSRPPPSPLPRLTALYPFKPLIPPKASPSPPPPSPTPSFQGPGGAPSESAIGHDLLRRAAAAKDADQVLQLLAEEGDACGVVSVDDCSLIIEAALDRGNTELALSIFSSMRAEIGAGEDENGARVMRWKWARPDVRTYTLLIRGLAACMRVSDAIQTIGYISRIGVSLGDEVPFGKLVRCPLCMVAIAVAQPQNGIQMASCSKCRYNYELVSGDIASIQSEEVSVEIPAWEKGLRFLQIIKQSIPAAIHSVVVQTPSGTARTHRFATGTVDLPAQEGERVTICSAASTVYSRRLGPFKFAARSPDFNPGEALSLTNHRNGLEFQLLRAPMNGKNSFWLSSSILVPAVAFLASGDAVAGFIDPTLPRSIAIGIVASVTLGVTLNRFVLPQMNQLPQRLVDVVTLKQQLLSQYDMLQVRIRDLILASEKEVWMLARMSQLEKKIVAVGEPSYRARRSRVKRVRESLEKSLTGRIELIESYAKISSMIEIEVEMDSNVPAAEATSNAESISEQIQQMMEIEKLEEASVECYNPLRYAIFTVTYFSLQRWRIQAEANDEVERLLSSQPL